MGYLPEIHMLEGGLHLMIRKCSIFKCLSFNELRVGC
jgi:hypothetical protein